MFLDEARLAATLDQANIAQVYDIGQTGGSYFFTMEYLHGEDLRRSCARGRRGETAAAQQAPHIVIGAAAGLHFAHEKTGSDGRPLDIVHRDISPSNIVVTYDGGVKVVDFGIAKIAADPELSKRYALKGKLAYMSPEQLAQRAVDRRSDVFSLGIVLYEISTQLAAVQGARPKWTRCSMVLEGVAAPSTIEPDYPPELEPIVMRMLEKDPAQARRVGARSAARSRGVCARSAPAHLVGRAGRLDGDELRTQRESGTRCPRRRRRRPPARRLGARHSDLAARRDHVTRPGGGVRVGAQFATPVTRGRCSGSNREVRRRGGRWLPSSSASGRWRSPPRCVRPQPRGRAGGRAMGARPARRSSCWWLSAGQWPSSPEPPCRAWPSHAAAAQSPTVTAMAPAGQRPASAVAVATASATRAAASGQPGRRFLGGPDQAPGRYSALFRRSLPRALGTSGEFSLASRSPPTDMPPRSPFCPPATARRRWARAWPTSARARCSRRNPLPSRFASDHVERRERKSPNAEEGTCVRAGTDSRRLWRSAAPVRGGVVRRARGGVRGTGARAGVGPGGAA